MGKITEYAVRLLAWAFPPPLLAKALLDALFTREAQASLRRAVEEADRAYFSADTPPALYQRREDANRRARALLPDAPTRYINLGCELAYWLLR